MMETTGTAPWIGAWLVQGSAVKANSTFPALMTFTSDGIVFADEAPEPLESSGHGSWEQTGPNEAAYTFVFLIGNTDRSNWMQATVSGDLQYIGDDDRWIGPFTFRQADREGNEVAADTGLMSGARIRARER